MMASYNTGSYKLSRTRLKKEIEAVKETIKKIEQVQIDTKAGIEINNIVLAAFLKELECMQ